MAAAAGVAPEVVGLIEPEGCLVTRFIGGEKIPPERLRTPEMIRRVVEALRPMLKRLHSVEASAEARITVHGDVERVLTCKASTVVADGRPVGTVMIFRTSTVLQGITGASFQATPE